jgi:predicted nucleic acid-binding protein
MKRQRRGGMSSLTGPSALDAWGRLSNDPRSFHIEANPSEHESRFVALVTSREPTPNLWADAWLAALAVSLDYEVTTFDRGLKAFRGLKLRLLEVR